MTTNPPTTDKTGQHIADVWDCLLPAALQTLLRDTPALILTPLAPAKDGRQRFLVSKIENEIME